LNGPAALLRGTKLRVLWAMVLGALFVTSGVGTGATAGASIPNGPISFGVITSESGILAEFGVLIKSGYEAAAQYVNKHGGIGGHKINLIVLNDAGDPAQNVTDGRQLLADHVAAVLEPGFDGINTGTQALLVQQGIPELWPIELATDTDTTKFPAMFSINAGDIQHAQAEADAVHTAGFTKVAVIEDTTPESLARYTLFKEDAAKYGITVTATEQYSSTSVNLTPQVAAAQAANAQALVVEVATEIPHLFAAMSSLKWYPVTFGDSGLTAGGNAQGADPLVLAHVYDDCPVYLKTGGSLPQSVTDTASIIEGLAPGIFGPAASAIGDLDAMDILKTAILKEGSTAPAKVVKGIETIHNESFSVPWIKYDYTKTKHVGDTYDPMCGVTKFGAGGMAIPTTNFS
jgi:ABC-type branched-subunit amino acid transport system substrate-binding protein